mgnify:FL=1
MPIVVLVTSPLVSKPVIIAHRGVPEKHLEHSWNSYRAGIEQGADYIEPDVLATKDGHLIVRHENEIGHTTDIAERREFTSLKTTKVVDGVELEGWFSEDLTLDQIKSLKTRERIPEIRPRNASLRGDTILTFDEVLQIQAAENNERGPDQDPIGVYVETKHPTYFANAGLDLNDLLLASLERFNLNRADAPIIIQSMETANLRRFSHTTDLPLVQLLEWSGAPADFVANADPRTYRDLAEPEGLDFIAEYAHGVGAHKRHVIGRDQKQRWTGETQFVEHAHARGLAVHVWTLRSENKFLPRNLRRGRKEFRHGDALAEHLAYFDAGVDGVFTDITSTAVAARGQWMARQAAAK